MEKSTHICPVVKLNKRNHENSDNLSLVDIGDTGYVVVINTKEWEGIDYGVYIPPDSVVDTTKPEFSFLADGKSNTKRIKAKKLRGIISYGLLVPVPADLSMDIIEESIFSDYVINCAETFGVEHYEPPFEGFSTSGNNVKNPKNYDYSKYDVDSLRGHKNIFEENEPVVYLEKTNGANSRFMYKDNIVYCGSRSFWKADEPSCIWWKAFRNTPSIENFCKAFPDYTLFGEVYGQVQKGFDYGKKGEAHFVSFDIRCPDGRFLNYEEWFQTCDKYQIPMVPILEVGPFKWESAVKHSNGKSILAEKNGGNHIREGVVIKPLVERCDDRLGRVILKLVGDDYLLGKG